MRRIPFFWSILTFACTTMFSQTVADDKDSAHWSFRPVVRAKLPMVAQPSWVRNPVDRFILRRLENKNITPSPEADSKTLIRRVSLDLIGLPPSPADVDRFLSDRTPGAYERFVDRLLASPHYAEKWARSWMDLCHYGDTDGYLTDQLRPTAWRYRDWLIKALNADMPFDQFTVQQLAGDLLPNASIDERIATGFLRQTLSNREGGADLEEFRVLQTVERTSMVGTIWLGLTVGCARCHDHFYDPISQKNFYEMYAFFDAADEVNFDAPLRGQQKPYRSAYETYQRQRQALIAPISRQLNDLQRRWELRLLRAYQNPSEDAHWDRQWELLGLVWGGGKGEGQLEGTEIAKLVPDKRTTRQHQDLQDYFLRTDGEIDPDEYRRLKLGEIRAKIDKLQDDLPPMSRAAAMRAAQNPRTTAIHNRGDFRDSGETVFPSVPACLPQINHHQAESTTSNRMHLAEWLVSKANPLTARVTVNRMWQDFFGRGLVATSGDFGAQGRPPTHPDLLDWLAIQFMDKGWNVKAMHRLIVTSATYRQSSLPRRELDTADPENRLLARQNSLRVSSEAVRDLALAVSGLLSRKMGGPGVKPPQPKRVIMEAFDNKEWEVSQGEHRYRRGIYTFVIRTAPFAQGAIFDAPNPNEICTLRERSTTPLQALTTLNDAVFFEAAEALAFRLLTEPTFENSRLEPASQRIELGFRICFSRSPTAREKKNLVDVFSKSMRLAREDHGAEIRSISYAPLKKFDPVVAMAWTNVSSVMLNLHEFIHRD